jgi:hypothetical protein
MRAPPGEQGRWEYRTKQEQAQGLFSPNGGILEADGAASSCSASAITADTDLRLGRYFAMSEGFFIGLQTDYELMQRRRQIGDKLKAIRPRAA